MIICEYLRRAMASRNFKKDSIDELYNSFMGAVLEHGLDNVITFEDGDEEKKIYDALPREPISPEDPEITSPFGDYQDAIFFLFHAFIHHYKPELMTEEERAIFERGDLLTELAKSANSKRTRQKALKIASAIKLPEKPLFLSSKAGFGYMMNYNPKRKTGLIFLKQANIEAYNGRFVYINGKTGRELTEEQVITLLSGNNLFSEIDLQLFSALYTGIYTKMTKEGNTTCTVYVPEFAKLMGYKGYLKEKDILPLINRIQEFTWIFGAIESGRMLPSIYPALSFKGYDAETNTFTFESPYIEAFVNKLRPDIKNMTVKPSLIKGNTGSGRSDHFAIYVRIKALIMQNKNNTTANIGIETLLEDLPNIKTRLEESTNPYQLINRLFSRAWDLLNSDEELQEWELPSSKNPEDIPTMRDYEKNRVFSFPKKTARNRKKDI